MNGFFLLVPFLLIRFGLLSALSRDAVRRAARFPPLSGGGRAAYGVYQLSTAALLLYPLALRVHVGRSWLFLAGAAVYGAGLLLCAASMVCFAAPAEGGFCRGGLYRVSRNPMYIAYFVFFAGCALLTRSLPLFGIVLAFQISAHWIILAEERWCLAAFEDAYDQYMRQVNRYIGCSCPHSPS